MRLSPVVDSAVDKVIHSSPHLCPQVWTNDIGVLPQFPQGSTNLWKTVRRAGPAPSKLSTASYPQSAVHSWLSTVARPQTRSRSCAAPARRRVALGGDGPHRGRVTGGHARYRGDQAGRPPPRPGDAAATLRPAGDPAGRSGGSPPGRSPGRRRGGPAGRAAARADRGGAHGIARAAVDGVGGDAPGPAAGGRDRTGAPPAPPRPRERPRRARGAPFRPASRAGPRGPPGAPPRPRSRPPRRRRAGSAAPRRRRRTRPRRSAGRPGAPARRSRTRGRR